MVFSGFSKSKKMCIRDSHQTDRILLRENDFVYILPHPLLRRQISNYTVTFPNKEIISDNYTVIPHGSATLVFSRGGSDLSSNLFGPLTKPCMVGRLANQYDMLLIIEFQPAGLSAFTGINQKELADQRIPFEGISSTSVSYTHLDVYKRQSLFRCCMTA